MRLFYTSYPLIPRSKVLCRSTLKWGLNLRINDVLCINKLLITLNILMVYDIIQNKDVSRDELYMNDK